MNKKIDYRIGVEDGKPIIKIKLIRDGSEFVPETKIEELINDLLSSITVELFLQAPAWHMFRLDICFVGHEYGLGIFRADLSQIPEPKFFEPKIRKMVNKFTKDLVSYVMKKWGIPQDEFH